MPLLAVMCVTGRCAPVTRNSDERHSRDQAGCAIKWTVAILESPASPHDPTQPPPKRRAGQSLTRGGDGSQSIPAPRRPIHLEELSASLKRAGPESFRSLPSAKSQAPSAKSQELRAFSLPQVRLFVFQIVVGVAEDHLLVFFIQVAAEFPWGAHPEGVRLHDRLFGNQRAGGDDGAASDDRAVEDDGAHADQAAGFNGAAVQDGVVAHTDVVAQVDAVLFFHAVEDTVVLNVGIVADADLVNIAAEDGVHPDAGVFAEDDVADQLGGVVDVASAGELGSDAFVGADHISEAPA